MSVDVNIASRSFNKILSEATLFRVELLTENGAVFKTVQNLK